ncbi:MAG: hypothetical protein M3503_03240 [Actinomycetota bacterium]|nr:hypothetical protein [Actinomycetota bacterium]
MGGLLRMAVRAGIAKKIWEEARKPENQAKAKELFAKLTDKGGATGAGPAGRQTRRTRRT